MVTEAVLEGVRDLSVERPDGRIVAWSEFGDEEGLPILRVPGTPGCRYSLRADRTPWMQRHLRMITTERPGFGASSRLPGRRFREPADDMAAILDHLGLDAVHVVGGSGSAPHQLASAAQHPDRVRAMTVLVGTAPPTDDEVGQMNGLNAEGYRLARDGHVQGLRKLMDQILTAMMEEPTAAFRTVMDRAPDADRVGRSVPALPPRRTRVHLDPPERRATPTHRLVLCSKSLQGSLVKCRINAIGPAVSAPRARANAVFPCTASR